MTPSSSVFDWRGQVPVADRVVTAREPRALRRVPKRAAANPWRITERQAEALNAMLKAESQKQAAKQLGIPVGTLRDLLLQAKRRMGVSGSHQHLLMWQAYQLAPENLTEPA